MPSINHIPYKYTEILVIYLFTTQLPKKNCYNLNKHNQIKSKIDKTL